MAYAPALNGCTLDALLDAYGAMLRGAQGTCLLASTAAEAPAVAAPPPSKLAGARRHLMHCLSSLSRLQTIHRFVYVGFVPGHG
jgi:hypothetical protein